MTDVSHLTSELFESEAFRSLATIQVSFAGRDRQTYENLHRLDYDEVARTS